MPVKKGSLACRNSTSVTQLRNPRIADAAMGAFHNSRHRPFRIRRYLFAEGLERQNDNQLPIKDIIFGVLATAGGKLPI